MIGVTILNPEQFIWYTAENAERVAVAAGTILAAAAHLAALVLYAELWDEAVDKRDDFLDQQKDVLDYVLDREVNADWPMMELKQEVLDLEVPTPDKCGDVLFCATEADMDGDVVDDLAIAQSKLACGGMPTGWGFGEGALVAKRAAAYAGSMLAGSGKRREEEFREKKTSLVSAAQTKSKIGLGPVLKEIEQAVAIQEGLASVFAAGFNSAGVGLGAAIGQLANQAGGNSGNGTV